MNRRAVWGLVAVSVLALVVGGCSMFRSGPTAPIVQEARTAPIGWESTGSAPQISEVPVDEPKASSPSVAAFPVRKSANNEAE